MEDRSALVSDPILLMPWFLETSLLTKLMLLRRSRLSAVLTIHPHQGFIITNDWITIRISLFPVKLLIPFTNSHKITFRLFSLSDFLKLFQL